MKRILNSIIIPAEKKTSVTLLLLALGFGLAGQVMLILSFSDEVSYWKIGAWFSSLGNNASPVLGLGLYVIAGILLVLSLQQGQLAHLPAFEIATQAKTSQPPSFGFWLTSAGLACLAAFNAFQEIKYIKPSYGTALIWVLSLALFSYSVLRQSGWRPPSLRACLAWVSDNRFELIGMILLLALASFMRTIDRNCIPTRWSTMKAKWAKARSAC
jgi:hypothetical protein